MGFYGFSEPHPVKDSDIVFTDNTSNDVSITKHGFVPKAPNDGTKFLDGAGAWASPPSSGASTADHFVVTATDADLSASTVIPGLAGSADIKGAGGAGTSEEYDTATTGLSWSPSTPTTVDSNTTRASCLYILNQADSTERIGTKAWSPGAGAFAAICKMSAGWNWANPNAGAIGLHIGNSDNSSRLLIQFAIQGAATGVAIQAYTYASSTYTQRGVSVNLPPQSEMYFKISRDGSNNVSYWVGATGKNWQLVVTQSFTLTVANIGFRCNSSASGTFDGCIDFLRTSV